MLKRFLPLIIISACLFSLKSEAQTQDSYEYQSEFTWGINKNTSGGLIGGLVFKQGKKVGERTLRTFGLEIMNVKHPQEVRRTTNQGNLYLYGKSNYLYAFRFQYGRDFIIFKKAPTQGVEIKFVTAAGLSLGVVAPYYVQVQADNGEPVSKQYNPDDVSATDIQGTGRLFEGITDSKIKPGGNLKAALNFELGTIKSQVTGFEVGFLVDAYTSKIVLVPAAKNYAVYPTLFISIFYGSRK
jgi:hypothetical protein